MVRGGNRFGALLAALCFCSLLLASCGGGTSSINSYDGSANGVSAAGGNMVKPVAVPGAFPTEGGYPMLVHLFDAGSYDTDGQIVKWEWNFDYNDGANGGWYDFTDTEGDAWFTYEEAGTYVAHLRVTDNDGNKDTGNVKIVLGDGLNAAPVAVANADPTSGNAPLEVSFDATGSYDPDGTIAAYEWDFGDGAGFEDYTASGGVASHTYTAGGSYTSTLRLTDDDGASATASVSIDVNSPPTAVANATPQSGEAPLEVQFSATGSSDPDGEIVSWEWNFGVGEGFQDYTPSEGAASYTYESAGDYTAVLRVTDDDGATDTASVPIHVTEIIVPQRGDWWAFGRDETHTHRSPYTGPLIPQLDWKTYLGGQLAYQSAVLAQDGTAYITSMDGNLYAINPNGTVEWIFNTGGPLRGSAMVGRTGAVYFGSDDGYFYAVDDTGSELWSYQISNLTTEAMCSPIQAPDGTIYIGSNQGVMYAFAENGVPKWTYQAGDGIQSSPAVGALGTVYFGSLDHYLYALTPTGSRYWRFDTGWRILNSSPAVSADDGTIYIGTTTNSGYSSTFYAVYPDGNLKWQTTTDGYIYSSPAIAADGSVYFGDGLPGSGSLYKFSAGGTLMWKLALGDECYSSPTIDSNGVVYVGSGYVTGNANKMNAVNSSGAFLWRYNMPGWVIGSPTMTSNGKLLFTCEDGYLYALENGVLLF